MDFEKLKQQLDPNEVLQMIGYEKSSPITRGKEVRDYCPVHGSDHQRSLSINSITKLCQCFSCGFKGNLIQLYAKAKGLTDLQAASELCKE